MKFHLTSIGENLNAKVDVRNTIDQRIILYSWRLKLQNRENFALEAPRESKLVVDPTIYESIPSNFDLPKSPGLPIVLRKPTRFCTLHPISKFVSYNTISPKFHDFTTNLDKIEILKQHLCGFKSSWMERSRCRGEKGIRK